MQWLAGDRKVGAAAFRATIWLLMLAGTLTPVAAAAELLPRPDQIALPNERALLSDTFLRLWDDPNADTGARLAALDAALARLAQPTRLRGFVQTVRASLLSELNKEAAAREAIEESIRLLPGYSGPLLAAHEIYAYDDQPGRAADYLLRASRIDPQIVSKLPEYDVDNLMRRLGAQQDQRRMRAVSERLLEIGWTAESLSGQSRLARRVIEARMETGDDAGAAALLPKLLSPADSRDLLAQNRYRALWPEIERWAGPALANQWRVYLTETREKWQASKDPATARAYVQVLDSAGHDDTIIREMLPLFSDELDPHDVFELVFVASPLAGALARKGRWDELEAMFARALTVWPLGKDANALNLAANRARYLFHRGKTAEGLQAMDAAIADAARWQGQVSSGALATMHQYRACMLHALGRQEQSILSLALAGQQGPSSVANMYLCLNKPDAARDVLIKALESEGGREAVLEYVQPADDVPMQSDYGRTIAARARALRADPKLLRAVADYGRVLPFTLSAGAPAE